VEKTEEFIRSLHLFADQFEQMVKAYDDTFNRYIELEKTINDYSVFITKESNQIPWKVLKKSGEIKDLINNLRENSAYSVKIMEKYRALKLLNEDEKSNRYFQNIESCIEEEFSSFHITAQSKVLLVGDDLKSLFNYPMKTVDDTKWHLIEQVLQPHNVFDVALYQKA